MGGVSFPRGKMESMDSAYEKKRPPAKTFVLLLIWKLEWEMTWASL